MALPDKKISKIKVDSSNTYDIVPSILQDGSTNNKLSVPTLTSDNDEVVTTKTNQTISGNKTFSNDDGITISSPTDGVTVELASSGDTGDNDIYFTISDGNSQWFKFDLGNGNFSTHYYASTYNYTLPSSSGTVLVAADPASNKNKYLHTNASTGALEWSTVSSGANYYAISDFTSSNGTKIATGYSSGTASTAYNLYAPNATASQAGLVTTGNQTFAGTKTFTSGEIKIQDPDYSSTIVTLAADGSEGADILTADCIFKAPTIVAENYLHANNLTFGKAVSGDTDHGLVLPNANEMSQWTADKTIAAREDISNMQASSVVVGNATTNINGRVFQNYTANLVTSGGYTFYQILKNGNNPTEDEAKEYMHYMTGSTFLPKYNYDFPKQTIFTFADRSTWKPQYSSSDGLRLYRLTTPLALDDNLVHLTGTETISGSKTFETAVIEQGSIYSTYVTRTYTRSAQLTNSGVEVSYQASGAVSADATATIGSKNIVFTENETTGPITDPILPYYTSYGGSGILYNPTANDSSTAYEIDLPKASGTLVVDADIIGRQIKEVDAVTQPTNSSNYVVYHITDSTITSLTEGLTIRVHKGLASSWPKDSSGAIKLIQINNLDPIAIFWRYNSFASWNSFDNVMMTLTYSATARPSSSDYYGYTSQAGFILDFTYDSGNDTYNLYDYGGYHTGSSALTAYSLVGWDNVGNRVPVINADGTVGVAFDYSRGVQYWETAVNANQNRAPWTGSAWYPRVTATILSSLITRYGFGTLTTTDRIYIKCSKNGRMLTPIELTKTLPSTKDDYYYMLFAKPYQEYINYTSNQTWTIFINQPIYYHNGSAVVPLESDDSNVVHKGTSSSSVAESIYGSKTFWSPIVFAGAGLSNIGSLGYDGGSNIKLSASGPNLLIESAGGTISIGNSSNSRLSLNQNAASSRPSSAYTFTDKYKATNSATVYTSTYTFPTKQTDGSYTIATTDDIASKANDSDVVHKGTSSSSVDEYVYGLKTFNAGIMLNQNSGFGYNIYTNSGTGTTQGIMYNSYGGSTTSMSAINMGTVTAGTAGTAYQFNLGSNSQVQTNAIVTMPHKTGTLAMAEETVAKSGDTMAGSLALNIGSGYSSSPNLTFVTSTGAGNLYKSDETLYFAHTGVHSYTLTFPMNSGTVATTNQLPQILDYRS